MPIVKAGDLAQWAASLPPDEPVCIGLEYEWEDDDSKVTPVPMSEIIHLVYLFQYTDPDGLGFVTTEDSTIQDCDAMCDHPPDDYYQGQHVCKGRPVWRLGL